MVNTANIDYAKSCTEVLAIIYNMSIKNFNKIPPEVIKTLEENKDSNYNFKLDYSKNINEQNISEFTIAILKNFYRDYWATEDTRQRILLDEANRRYEKEKIKYELYNPDNVFKNMNKSNNSKKQTAIVPAKKENIFKRLLRKLKNNIWRKTNEKEK